MNGAEESPVSPRPEAAAAVSLTLVIAVTLGTLAVGALIKHPCAAGSWADGRQYRRLCYSDIVPLYSTEFLEGGRLPYLDACPPHRSQCDEYPVLTMYFMRAAAWVANAPPAGTGFGWFFYANAVLLTGLAVATAAMLHRLAGSRALYFASAPTLLIYAFVNWDLLAVALATAASLAYLRRRDGTSGALLGLGVAAKLYPALLVAPFAFGRLRQRDARAAAVLVGTATGAWIAVNLPFALAAPSEWATFFRFNSDRGADWDSLWFVACTGLGEQTGCTWSSDLLNAGGAIAFLFVAAVAWSVRNVRQPDFPRWTLGFPLLAAFLLTNKVYSPQYGLWLLPWFALALPNLWLFVAFQAADVAVFITRFTFFGRLAGETGDPALEGFAGASLRTFQIALLLRAAILVLCVAAWSWRRRTEPELLPRIVVAPSLTPAPPAASPGRR